MIKNVVMESGFTTGACTSVTVSIIKDGVLEGDETFQLTATDFVTNAMPSSTNGATVLVTIVDDDSPCELSSTVEINQWS